MSWPNIFPYVSTEMIREFREKSTSDEKSTLKNLFKVHRKFNQKETTHTLATSLFCKNKNIEDPEVDITDLSQLQSGTIANYLSRYAPWAHYVQPILQATESLKVTHPHVTVRVYLARDLEFLVSTLSEAGCEIFLMASSSIRHNPGAMWRYLALEEPAGLVTITDSDRLRLAFLDIERTEAIRNTGHAYWRVPVAVDEKEGLIQYRPIMASQFGATMATPKIRELMMATIWHSQRGSISTTIEMFCRTKKIIGSDWPGYGFDEWFLLVALFPRIIKEPNVILVEDIAVSRFLPLDVEYSTWGNPDSEMIYFNTAGCCSDPGEYYLRSNGRVLLTGIWQVSTMNDVMQINEMHIYSKTLDVKVELKPVLHVKNQDLLGLIDLEIVNAAIIWRDLAYNVAVQDHLLSAIIYGHNADWIWQADSDERVDFSVQGGLRAVLKKAEEEAAEYIPGIWIDRIALNGLLPVLNSDLSLAEQFPLAVLATRYFQGSDDRKIALHRRECFSSVGNHTPANFEAKSTSWRIPIWHFKWHSDFAANQASKIKSDENSGWIWQFNQALAKVQMKGDLHFIEWSGLPVEAWKHKTTDFLNASYPIISDQIPH